ncbi:MAG: MATE family efflux transporter [Lachnospiraceae bacterium]|nr:MATE family efflux transporter [Lachnospiraceae bacterium]
MSHKSSFTEGPILKPLLLFAGPIFLALFLQAMYGAVDLLVVGQFAESADVSAVATGTQIMNTITYFMNSLAMGTTILLGQQIGEGKPEEGGRTVGASIILFACIALISTVLILIFAPQLAGLLNAPEEAFSRTVSYVRICGGGTIVIISYNLIGSIFRGMGDSRTPLVTVAIACAINIAGDLLLVAVFHMGTRGAAIATVSAQAVSVIASYFLIRKKQLPFEMKREFICPDGPVIKKVVGLGLPLALQNFLVNISFLVLLAIVNDMGLAQSAGMGTAQKVCTFIMLVSLAFSQAMSAFVAHNYGAGRMDRARKALYYGIGASLVMAVFMFYLGFFHGDMLTGIFSADPEVVQQGFLYLKAYAIDCFLTAIFFCFIGFYNGIGMTRYVMIMGILSAFCVRIPVSYFMSRMEGATLFHIGLATPCASLLQTIMCIAGMFYVKKKFGLGKYGSLSAEFPDELLQEPDDTETTAEDL